MTDKQIIIDGVDVSGCIYYDANADKESYFLHDCEKEHAPCWSCSSMPSCLYKKYKRKEQECEELQSHFKQIDESNKILYQEKCELLQQLDQLKAENERFKVNKHQYCFAYDETCLTGNEKCVYYTCGFKSILKLKQTLTEIKEYLKPYLCRGGVEPQWVEWQMAQREKEKMAKDIFQILQKISEVEDA